jgi:hypothetical protein
MCAAGGSEWYFDTMYSPRDGLPLRQTGVTNSKLSATQIDHDMARSRGEFNLILVKFRVDASQSCLDHSLHASIFQKIYG